MIVLKGKIDGHALSSDRAFFVEEIAFFTVACYTEFKKWREVIDVKCPVCCENFSGERCPHCGMRVGKNLESRLFSGESSFSAQKVPERPVQKTPVRLQQNAPMRAANRRGKVSLAALERRQEAGRKTRRAMLWVVGISVTIMLLSLLSALFEESSMAPQPEEVPADSYVYDSTYTDLEIAMEDWAADRSWDALFFYVEEDDTMNGSLYLEDLELLAEQAAAGDEEALARWQEAEDQCEVFYEASREYLDDDGRGKMLLTAWLSDYESGNLVLAMDEDGIWYSYYEDLVAGQDE